MLYQRANVVVSVCAILGWFGESQAQQQFSRAFLHAVRRDSIQQQQVELPEATLPETTLYDEFVPTASVIQLPVQPQREFSWYATGSKCITVGSIMYAAHGMYYLYVRSQQPASGISSYFIPKSLGQGAYLVIGTLSITGKTLLYKTLAQLLFTATVGDMSHAVDYLLSCVRRWIIILIPG